MDRTEGINRIHELTAELVAIASEIFPGCTRISTVCDTDGYVTWDVLKWVETEDEIEKQPRRYCFMQSKLSGGTWQNDVSEHRNAYLKEHGILAEE